MKKFKKLSVAQLQRIKGGDGDSDNTPKKVVKFKAGNDLADEVS
jgi:hypothetical protein